MRYKGILSVPNIVLTANLNSICQRTLYSNGNFVTIPVFVLPYCIQYVTLFLYYPFLLNFSVSYYPFCVFTAHSLQLSLIVHAPLALISYFWVTHFLFFKRASFFLQSPCARVIQSPRARIPSPRACTLEPLSSLFYFSRFVQSEPLRSQCI